MVYYKSCDRCDGDMHERHDTYGIFKECIQCGAVIDLSELPGMALGSDSRNSKSNQAA
jgi:hypothetical protein